jgi:hypothetical protein
MQVKFHEFLESKKRQGYHKFVVIKARQLGISTYTQARLFNKTAYSIGKNTLILSHDLDSSNSIFNMVKRFYANIPYHVPKPVIQNNNRKALIFDEIDSSYIIGTANAKESGRGSTINYFHGSEVAFWREADELMKSVFQTIPDNQNSEIILESTANGIGNYFYNICITGMDPKSEFQTLFLPWYINPEYVKPINDPDFKLDDEEKELKQLFNLTDNQLNWRRHKIRYDFLDNVNNFRQEYPATVEEAFITNEVGLIPVDKIRQARLNHKLLKFKYDHNNCRLPKIAGLDPAREKDRTVVAIRQGRCIQKITEYYKTDTNFIINIVKDLIENEKIDFLFMDYAYGYAVWDHYKYTNYARYMRMVHFNGKVDEYFKSVYTNKRSEMHGKFRDWVIQEGGCSIPDSDRVEVEIASLPDFKKNANGQNIMPPKDEIKKILGGKSPDITDSIILTFAEDVKPRSENTDNSIKIINKNRRR